MHEVRTEVVARKPSPNIDRHREEIQITVTSGQVDKKNQ